MAGASLILYLRQMGRRLFLVWLASGLGWGLTAAVLVVLAAAWLDLLWDLSAPVRLAATVASLATALVVLAGACWLARRQAAPQGLAGRLDRVGQTGGQIRSGIDLVLEPRPPSALTAGLADMAVERAGRLAGTIDKARAIPRRPVFWALGSLGLLGLALAAVVLAFPRLALTQWLRLSDPFGDHPPYSHVVFHVSPGDVRIVYGSGLDIRARTDGAPVEQLDLILQSDDADAQDTLAMFPETNGEWQATITNVTAPGRYFVRARSGRSARFRINVFTIPRVEKVRFRITPPAYTRRPPYEGALPQGGLEGLPGTRVQVWAASNRPLSGGRLTVPSLKGNQSIPLLPTGSASNEVTGAFVIKRPGKLTLKVVDIDRQSSADAFTAAISLLKDERPFIRILEPPALSLVTPTATLPVLLAAEDDYGIARIQLFRSLNDSRPLPQDVRLPALPPVRWSEPLTLPLSAYGLSPGDEIKLFARVEDNDPAGPNSSESPIVVVRVISQEQFNRMVITRQGMEVFLSKYREAQRRLEKLADKVDRLRKKTKGLPKEGKLSKQLQQELDRLVKEMHAQAEAIRKSGDNHLPYDLDKALSRHLHNMARRLTRMARSPGANLKAGTLAKLLKDWQQQLGQNRTELQREANDPLEFLASVMPLLEDAARFVELYQRQLALAERLKSLEGRERPDDPAIKIRMRALQGEQHDIRGELARLLDDMEDHIKALPEDRADPRLKKLREEARAFVRLLRGSGAAEAMLDAETGLAAFSGTRGYRSARKAAEILAKFISRCQAGLLGQGKICLRFRPVLHEGLGDTVSQLLGQAGLLPGSLSPGMQGNGSGGGYSARRNTLDNVGLYGQLPGLDEAGGFSRMKQNRSGRGYRGKGAGPAGHSAAGAGSEPGAAGAGGGSVPPPYRQRVAEYFQRIVEETDGR